MSDIGTSDPTPYDFRLLALLIAVALMLIVGAVTHPAWSLLAATLVRRGLTLLAALVTVAVLYLTPTTNGIVGASRLFVLWPAVTVTGIAYFLWVWRARCP